MAKSKAGTILKEKDRISSNLNTLNHATLEQKYKKRSDSPRKSQINGVPSKKSTSPFSPTTKKSRKKRQVSQSNKIDIWLNKSGEEKRCKFSSKSSELSMTEAKTDRREKENLSNEGRQIEFKENKLSTKSVSPKTSIKDMPSQTETNSSTKHSLKVASQNPSRIDKSSRKRSERESKSETKADRCEKENLNNEGRQIEFKKDKLSTKSVSPRTSIKAMPSQTETNSSTKHNLKEVSQNSSKSDKSSRKRSERESKNAKVKSHSGICKAHSLRLSNAFIDSFIQKDLDSFINKEDKHNKPKRDNRKLQPAAGCSSSGRTSRREDSHKEISNSNKEPTREKSRSKIEVEKSLGKHENLNKSSDSSIKKTYKQNKNPENDKNMDKSKEISNSNKEPTRKKSRSKAIKTDSVWLSKNGGHKDKLKDKNRGRNKHKDKDQDKDKHRDKTETKYDKLPIKISYSRSTENLDEKSKSRKISGSKTESSVRNSRDKQENLDKKTRSSRKRSRSKTKQDRHASKSFKGQEKLDSYLIKNLKPVNKRKFSRSDSNDSCELPSFKNVTKKPKRAKKDEFFKKYGISIPSVEEILKEKKDLEKYRQRILSLEKLEDRSFELPFSVKDLTRTQETYNDEDVLDCKHLSLDEITAGFKKNLTHISAIFHGKQFNERHDRYFNNNNTNCALTVKNLFYNTSMIVFDFDQKEHMISLLKDEFDPEDKWTPYFFQVLLPELCMKIFMDAHSMTYDEAVKYLDTRPIVDD